MKFNNDIVIKDTSAQTHGLVYSINGGQPELFDGSGSTSALLMSFLAGNGNNLPLSFASYVDDGTASYPPLGLPAELDTTKLYFHGLNAEYLRILYETLGAPELVIQESLASATDGEVSVTYYPASKLSASVDVDIFDLIIDPADYSAAEVGYFAAHGITPAIKNTDGSYTVKSQLTVLAQEIAPPDVTMPN